MRKMFIRKLDSKIPKISIPKCLKQVPLGKLIKYSNPCFIGVFFFKKKKKEKRKTSSRKRRIHEGRRNKHILIKVNIRQIYANYCNHFLLLWETLDWISDIFSRNRILEIHLDSFYIMARFVENP